MSRLTHEPKNPMGRSNAAVSDMAVIRQDLVAGANAQQLTSAVMSMESMSFNFDKDEGAQLRNEYDRTIDRLKESVLCREYLEGVSPQAREIALECAALTMMASGNTESWFRGSAFTTAALPNKDAVVVEPSQGILSYPSEEQCQIAMEGFDPASANNWMDHSASANALATIQGGFEEAWYPIQIVPAGIGGTDVNITIPKIMQPVYRAGGSGAVTQFNKVSVVEAYVDDTILDNPVTTIWPVATDGTTPAALTPAAVVPNVVKQIGGVTIDTRPILFNTEVDIIDVSSHPGLIANGVMNETDNLDSVIRVGTVYMEVGVTDSTGPTTHAFVMKQDVSSQLGSLLIRVADGRGRKYITNTVFEVVVDQDTAILSSASNANQIDTLFNAALGQSAGDAFKFVFEVEVSTSADTEFGTMKVNLAGVTLKAAYDASGEAVALAANHTIAMTGKGVMPIARRTNSNLRSRGTIVDSTDTQYFRFPTRMHAPIMTQNPVGGQQNTSIEGLAHVQRIYNNNNAHKALFAAEEQLASNNGITATSPMIGATLVQPTYIREGVDVTALVQTMNSKENLDNLRATLLSAIVQMASQLLVDSRYLAALEFTTGNNTDVEVLVNTDPTIFQYLMEGGEPRTMGQGRNYRITQSLNSNMKNRIYVGLRRKTRDGNINPLDNGVFLSTPALTHEVQVSRGSPPPKKSTPSLPTRISICCRYWVVWT